MSAVKWLCVVNLAGIHGPFPVKQDEFGVWWDKSGNWSPPKRPRDRIKDGRRYYLYGTEAEAKCWLAGARAVANQVRSLCK